MTNTRAAILCLTRDNLDSRWLNFEAGALAKFLDTRVIPLLFNMRSTELSGPLALLQYATFEPGHASNIEEMAKILRALNESENPPLVRESILSDALEDRWQRLEDQLTGIADFQDEPTGSARPQAPKPEDVLSTLLDLVRNQGREFVTLRREVSTLRKEIHASSAIRPFRETTDAPTRVDDLSLGTVKHIRDELMQMYPLLKEDLGRDPTVEEMAASLDVHPSLLRTMNAWGDALNYQFPGGGDPEIVRR